MHLSSEIEIATGTALILQTVYKNISEKGFYERSQGMCFTALNTCLYNKSRIGLLQSFIQKTKWYHVLLTSELRFSLTSHS